LCQSQNFLSVDNSTDPAATRAAIHDRADNVPRPQAARQLQTILVGNGFTDVTVEVHTAVLAGPVAILLLGDFIDAEWAEEQARKDRLFVAIPMLLATGTRVD
jgi:hypothetical protein